MGAYSLNGDMPTFNGIPMIGTSQKDFSGSTYFVDNNAGSDGNGGKSFGKAFKTLAKAITISNLDIARGADRWARRNTIFFSGDLETATLVAFPNKCDVIGVGSYDANDKPGILGNHAPVNAGNYGTRFFNVWFKGVSAAPIVTLASSSSGIQFIGCTFDANAVATTAITATASPFLQVLNNTFIGAFVTAYIAFGAGECGGSRIVGNEMSGAAAGITSNSATASWRSVIKDNFIQATVLCIDDNDDIWYVINNTCVTAATVAAGGTAAFDANAYRSARNNVTGGTGVNVNYPTIILS